MTKMIKAIDVHIYNDLVKNPNPHDVDFTWMT